MLLFGAPSILFILSILSNTSVPPPCSPCPLCWISIGRSSLTHHG